MSSLKLLLMDIAYEYPIFRISKTAHFFYSFERLVAIRRPLLADGHPVKDDWSARPTKAGPSTRKLTQRRDRSNLVRRKKKVQRRSSWRTDLLDLSSVPVMFSAARAHHASAYGFGQSYCYPTATACGQYNESSPVMSDMTYQQNLTVAWPTVYSTGGTCGRQYDDWLTTGTAGSRDQPQQQNYQQSYHHVQRSVDNGPCGVSAFLLQQQDLSGSVPEGQTSPGSLVAQSSDGLSGSESPGAHSLPRPQPARSPFEWMKKSSYQSQPNPGKTRTKDKYRVVYTDHQRLELEKEFYSSRYITIRRKTEVAALLGLSERQVKIWFQNRRAKERKMEKKNQEIFQKSAKDTLNPALAALNMFKPLLQFEQDNQGTRLLWDTNTVKTVHATDSQ